MSESSSLTPEDVARLVQQSKQGDKEAYNQLYAFYGSPIWRFITSLIGDRDEARDLMQETFVKGWCDLGTLRDNHCFKSWLYTISFNITKTFLRRRDPKRWVSWEEHEQVIVTKEEWETIAKLEDHIAESELLKLALDHVTPTYRACLLLWLEDLPHKNIAEMLNIPAHNVSTNIKRGKEQLRRAYFSLEGEIKYSGEATGISQRKEEV